MNKMAEQIVVVAIAIIGVAILAVLVSKNSNTANVISSFGNAFSNSLKAAISPITGAGSLG